MKRDHELIKSIDEMEAFANIMILKANEIKKLCHQQRRKLEGVSTSSNARKGVSETEVANAIMRRRKNRLKRS